MLTVLALGLEILAAILGTYFFYKYRDSGLRLWIILLYLAPAVEFIGSWYSNTISYNNHIIFNIYDILSTVILFKLLYHLTLDTQRKRWILILGCSSVLLFFINGTYASIITDFLLTYKAFGTAILIIAIAIYLIDMLKRNTVVVFQQNLGFIVFTGYLIFNIAYLPIYFTYQYIMTLDSQGGLIFSTLHGVQMSVVILINLLFIFGLFWSKMPAKTIGQ